METAAIEKKPVQKIFARHEKKYLLTRMQFECLYERLHAYMDEDAYGLSTVCSVYYDNDQNELIQKSIDKPVYKEKFRVRSYGVPREDSRVFAEIKKKFDGVVYKRRVMAPYREMMDFVEKGRALPEDAQIQKEIRYMLERYRLHPAVYIAYDRLALAGKEDPETRVTFDFNTRFRTDHLRLSDGDYGEKLRSDDFYVCETKIANSAPLWLAKLLAECRIYPGTFSKYGTCYKEHILPEMMAEEVLKKCSSF